MLSVWGLLQNVVSEDFILNGETTRGSWNVMDVVCLNREFAHKGYVLFPINPHAPSTFAESVWSMNRGMFCSSCIHWVWIKVIIGHRLSMLPSGKRLHNYGKSPCLRGKITISMTIFNSKLLVITTGWFVWLMWLSSGALGQPSHLTAIRRWRRNGLHSARGRYCNIWRWIVCGPWKNPAQPIKTCAKWSNIYLNYQSLAAVIPANGY